jgi:hypothetical protein
MNYNFDTDMDLDWAADQLRRKQNCGTGLPDTPLRRVTAALKQGGPGITICDPAVSDDSTLGNALSALTIHSHSSVHCYRICESILALVADRDRVQLHQELVHLEGVQSVLGVVRQHEGPAAEVALRILDKLSRTSARQICAAGGVDVLIRCCERDGQTPRVLEVALRVLHGLTFDSDSKILLLRRGVRGLAEALLLRLTDGARTRTHETSYNMLIGPEKEEAEAWQDVETVITRLLHRLSDGQKGYSRRFEEARCKKKLF